MRWYFVGKSAKGKIQSDTSYCPQDATGFFAINFSPVASIQTDTNYCPQDNAGFFDFDQAP